MNNNNSRGEEHQRNKESLDSRINQTLENVQGLLKGRSIPGKVLLTRRTDQLHDSGLQEQSPTYQRSVSHSDAGTSDDMDKSLEGGVRNTNNSNSNTVVNKSRSSKLKIEKAANEVQSSEMGTRATDSARVTKFSRELSGQTVILKRLRELAWSGVPPYMCPNVWRLLLVSSELSDLGIRDMHHLRRKRVEYLDCVGQFYDIPDTEQSADEISMLRQISLDCPRTVSDVAFFQQAQVQKSLKHILYTWAIRHPASGFVQGINDLVTPFLGVFLLEYLAGSTDSWSMSDMPSEKISDIEADCYWFLSKLLDGMQNHYTFAQPGIQRLVFKLKELVSFICLSDFSVLQLLPEPVYRHMENQGLEYLQFAFCWFNCLFIREIPFHLVTRLWDTYLAEGDALPDFLVYIFASFLLTVCTLASFVLNCFTSFHH
ncbi:Ypt/Rab-GAP domain of gyp1p superfamily protein isoform 2 [Hibiscus syriacus]|uniref:Ypt/Rab-GAP domain of gyp1p superfamily protein isoform 2 n=1 Tax=Hibiscus syriacus TaxID=106335 RepID=A0A6A3AIS4_HIBSY|nr:Ypt/Rab-GAP domain of gyp1p superfamily protein isoform 2 [Hibiscus syriacus]